MTIWKQDRVEKTELRPHEADNGEGAQRSDAPKFSFLHRLAALTVLCAMFTAVGVAQQAASTGPTYVQTMNRIALPLLAHRRKTVAEIHKRAQVETRQAQVRRKILRLIGGLPDYKGPLNAKVTGTIPEDGFNIERVIYDSLRNYRVTANLYLPTASKGPFPAVIIHEGHGPFGKAGAFTMAANLARNGIAVLAYDPLGSGERLEAMNPATGKSWAGPDEHSQAEIPISLIGDHVSRYMVWDAMRGIDYLATRPEIDASAIGSFGCSGGGTMSAYLTALDSRVKAGVVACYITSYEQLLQTIGPQDGEQVIPNFIKDGLDLPDLVELVAPRPYIIVSTTEDMFPFAGAQQAYTEAERFYSLYGTGDRLQFFTGPGHHGAIAPMMPKVIAFFSHWLAHKDIAPPEMVNLKRPSQQELNCTATGQVTTGLPGERTIYQINRERAREVLPRKTIISSRASAAALRSRLRTQIIQVNGMDHEVQTIPILTVTSTAQRRGYQLKTVVFHSHSGMELPAMLALPAVSHVAPAVLMASSLPIEKLSADGSEFDSEARAGKVVLLLHPLPWPASTDAERPTLGTDLPWTSRAFLVGKTYVGMRTEDVLGAVAWLAQQREVNPHEIDAWGEGASGVVVLHAAVLDPSIRHITLEHSLVSYQSVLDADVHRKVAEDVIPDVMLHYDLDDLMIAAYARSITVVGPVDGEGRTLTQGEIEHQLARVYAADKALRMDGRLRFATVGSPYSDVVSSERKNAFQFGVRTLRSIH